jgi:hypothetical protein
MYTYVRQNPWTHFDPEGLDWQNWAGGLKAVGGGFEVAVGVSVAVAAGWTGVGAVVGAAIALHGADTIQSGVRQAATGHEVDSLTSTGLQKAGLSKSAANLTDAGIGVVGSLGAGVATGLTKAAAVGATEEAAGMTTAQILNATDKGSKALSKAAYDAVGGNSGATALQKAAAIDSGKIAGTGGINLPKAVSLAGTGLTAKGDIGSGALAATYQAGAKTITDATAPKPTQVAPSPTSSARATAPPTPAPPPPPPPPKQNS